MIRLLYGPDTYHSKMELQKIREEFLKKTNHGGFSVITLNGEDLDTESFRRNILSNSLFANKRFIIIESLLKQKKDKNLFQAVTDYLKTVKKDKDNEIIFWEEAVEQKTLTEEQKELFDLLLKEGKGRQFFLWKEGEVTKWIQEEFSKNERKIQSKAAQFLAQEIGPDFWRLKNEIDKLLAQGQETITAEDVSLLVYPRPEEEIWPLIDAISEKNQPRAIKLLSDQLALGDSVGRVINLIARQYRIILQVKEIMESQKSVNQYQIAKKLKIHSYPCQKAMHQAQYYTLAELKKLYAQLLSVDIKTKTTPVEPEVLIDLLIANLH